MARLGRAQQFKAVLKKPVVVGVFTTNIKKFDGLARGSIKKWDGLADASVKKWNGLA